MSRVAEIVRGDSVLDSYIVYRCRGTCGRTLRPRFTSAEQYPGTVEHQGLNMCNNCQRADPTARTPRRDRYNQSVYEGFVADRHRRGIPPDGLDAG